MLAERDAPAAPVSRNQVDVTARAIGHEAPVWRELRVRRTGRYGGSWPLARPWHGRDGGELSVLQRDPGHLYFGRAVREIDGGEKPGSVGGPTVWFRDRRRRRAFRDHANVAGPHVDHFQAMRRIGERDKSQSAAVGGPRHAPIRPLRRENAIPAASQVPYPKVSCFRVTVGQPVAVRGNQTTGHAKCRNLGLVELAGVNADVAVVPPDGQVQAEPRQHSDRRGDRGQPEGGLANHHLPGAGASRRLPARFCHASSSGL